MIDVIAELRWNSTAEGGVKVLPFGPTYAANVYFRDDPELWSVMLFLPEGATPPTQGTQKVGLGFPFLENMEKLPQQGDLVYISEGPVKVIAEGSIIEILF